MKMTTTNKCKYCYGKMPKGSTRHLCDLCYSLGRKWASEIPLNPNDESLHWNGCPKKSGYGQCTCGVSP